MSTEVINSQRPSLCAQASGFAQRASVALCGLIKRVCQCAFSYLTSPIATAKRHLSLCADALSLRLGKRAYEPRIVECTRVIDEKVKTITQLARQNTVRIEKTEQRVKQYEADIEQLVKERNELRHIIEEHDLQLPADQIQEIHHPIVEEHLPEPPVNERIFDAIVPDSRRRPGWFGWGSPQNA